MGDVAQTVPLVIKPGQTLVADEIRGATRVYEDPTNQLVGDLAFNDDWVVTRSANFSLILLSDEDFWECST